MLNFEVRIAVRLLDVFEHLQPFMDSMDQTETGQRAQCLAQTQVSRPAALDSHEQAHAEKRQSIKMIDQDERKVVHLGRGFRSNTG